ncbi:MAG TPA: DUF4430 domain-containing protein [Gaiellaceae bacterium]|nr:DUF4430 domain-containing protein [Gaiellaceae bacterium]
MRRALPLLLVLALVACGGGGAGDGGSATLWVTRDRGATVLYDEQVPAGETVLQALDRVADVETRYGGRFVQAVDGIEGSLDQGRDWFFFVNGIAGDRSAAEYRLRAGEIAWWDYRAWADEPELQVVVGAFPEPFLHGFDGRVREAVVVFGNGGEAALARRLARVIGGRAVRERAPEGANVLRLRGTGETLRATVGGGSTGPVRFDAGAAAARALVQDPSRYARRFSVP